MIKIYNNIKHKPTKEILANYKGQLIKSFSSAKKTDYPVFDGSSGFSVFEDIYTPQNPGVYFVHDKRGILYIGRTNNIHKRFTQHAWRRQNKKLFKLSQNPFGKLKFSWVSTKNEEVAKKYENKWIRLFLPICNEILNTNNKQR